ENEKCRCTGSETRTGGRMGEEEVTLRTICRRGHAKEPSGRCKECERLRKMNVTPYLKSSPTRTAASARAVASASDAVGFGAPLDPTGLWRPTAWLGWEDSNSEMSTQII